MHYLSALALAFFIPPVLGASGASTIHIDAHAVTCQTFSISWTGGTAPYTLSLQDNAAPDPPLESLTQTDTTYVWLPDVPAGTIINLQLTDSAGTLAQTSRFIVQKGTDTSCVVSHSSLVSVASATGSATSIVSAGGPSSAAPISGESAIATSTSGGNNVLIAAIVVPIALVIGLVLLFLFLRLRKVRREANPFEDPEKLAGEDVPPAVLDPFESESTNSMSVAPIVSEKSLPGPQVTPQELQQAIDRIQEMYSIIRGMQSSASSTAANERVVELQRQIDDLMADNAVLSGEQPPEYESARSVQ